MNLAQNAVAGIQIRHQDAEGVDVHDGVEALLLVLHLVVDGVQVLFAAQYGAFDPRIFETPLEFGVDLVNHFLAVAARGSHDFLQYPVAVGIQRFKAELFQFDLDIVDTEAVGQRREDLQGFAGNAAALVRAQGSRVRMLWVRSAV